MAQFLLLLHENPGIYAKMSPEEMQRVIEKYTAWSGKVGQSGHLAGGHKLKDEGGKHLKGKQKPAVVDGPYSETKEVIGGYFLINAKDYAEAVKVSSDCPHMEYGWIEVREIDPMGAE